MSQDLSCGFEFITTPDLQGCLTEALQCNYSFVVSPLIHPRFSRQHSFSSNKVGVFTRSDMILSPQDWATRIVGRLSQHLDVDVESPVVRQRHEECLTEELSYCKGLGLSAIMLLLHGCNSNNLARILQSYYETSHHPALIWIRVPMACRRALRKVRQNENPEECDDDVWSETWYWWSKFHERLEWDKRVGVVLELSADLPSQEIINRWLGEPVKAIVVPTHLFHNNKKGFPVLSRAHQQLVVSMVEHEAQVIISGARRHDIKHYLQYMQRLWMRRHNVDDPMLLYARGWEDYLQTPLQPLADNLDTHTYNVFEKDPVKYDQYQKAIAKALLYYKNKAKKDVSERHTEAENLMAKLKIGQSDNTTNLQQVDKQNEEITTKPACHSGNEAQNCENKKDTKFLNGEGDSPVDVKIEDDEKTNSSSKVEIGQGDAVVKESGKTPIVKEEPNKTPLTVMVLGAGRGPLVRATFNAADITNTKVKVIVVEKNPCAVVVLAAQVREVWRDRDVTVVPGDMRRLNLSPKADIIVSELLGSWGDNELSPECLDGAAGLLKPSGISIPSAYTSYVAPISSARLWAAAKVAVNGHNAKEKNLETLWVVYMQNKHHLSEPKSVFTFEHPAKGIRDFQGQEMTDWRGLPLTDNRRCETICFKVSQDSVMHGFGGYFDCALYGGEMLSIVPSTHSPGMISWFPVFIPIKTPMRVHRGEVIKATFWRCVDSRRVWYEWLVEVGDRATTMHNTNGRSSEMLL